MMQAKFVNVNNTGVSGFQPGQYRPATAPTTQGGQRMLGSRTVELKAGEETIYMEWPDCFDPVRNEPVASKSSQTELTAAVPALYTTPITVTMTQPMLHDEKRRQVPESSSKVCDPGEKNCATSLADQGIQKRSGIAEQTVCTLDPKPTLTMNFRFRASNTAGQDSSERDVSDDESGESVSSETCESDESTVQRRISDVDSVTFTDTRRQHVPISEVRKFLRHPMFQQKKLDIDASENFEGDDGINSFSTVDSKSGMSAGDIPHTQSEARTGGDNGENENVKCAEEYIRDDAHRNNLGELDSEKMKTEQEVIFEAIKADIAAKSEQKIVDLDNEPKADKSVAKEDGNGELGHSLLRYWQPFAWGSGSYVGTNNASVAMPGESDEDFAKRISGEMY